MLIGTMKTAIHPDNYRFVVFEDLNNGERFLTRSTVQSEGTTKWEDGNEYPIVKVHIASTSHPFFTGQEKLVDIEGRVDKFEKRRIAAAAAKEARATKTAKAPRKQQTKYEDPSDEEETTEPQTAKIGNLKTN